MNTPEQVAAAFAELRQRLRAAGGDRVRVVAVTKGFGPEAMTQAQANGADAVGENYVQELIGKLDELGAAATTLPPIHFIGQLQTNKVRHLAGRVDRYSSVDRPSLIREIARRDPGAEILIQVAPPDAHAGADVDADHVTTGKGGCNLSEVDTLVETASNAGLSVAGLMTVGPTEGGPSAAAAGFAAVRTAVDRLGLTVCSMGMSADLEVAVAEGSTEVRIGSALFGNRRYPNRASR